MSGEGGPKHDDELTTVPDLPAVQEGPTQEQIAPPEDDGIPVVIGDIRQGQSAAAGFVIGEAESGFELAAVPNQLDITPEDIANFFDSIVAELEGDSSQGDISDDSQINLSWASFSQKLDAANHSEDFNGQNHPGSISLTGLIEASLQNALALHPSTHDGPVEVQGQLPEITVKRFFVRPENLEGLKSARDAAISKGATFTEPQNPQQHELWAHYEFCILQILLTYFNESGLMNRELPKCPLEMVLSAYAETGDSELHRNPEIFNMTLFRHVWADIHNKFSAKEY